MLHDRSDLAVLCNERGLKEALEVGTHQGVFADAFMAKFEGTLTCVDTWRSDGIGPHETFLPNFVNQPISREFDEQLARLILGTKYPNRVKFLKMTSVDAAREFDEESLDFVYLDGDHRVRAVKRDFQSWWPKIRRHGILAGHDYAPTDPNLAGVAAVVNWFVVQYELDLQLTYEEFPSWYVTKS